MASDPQVDLIFSHFIPRYEAAGVDPNDLRKLMAGIDRWDGWCKGWSEFGLRHEQLADDAKRQGRHLTAAEAYVRAAIYYHYGKHLFADHADEFAHAHHAMLRCYTAGVTTLPLPAERVLYPYRGLAALSLDGPGQGETSFHLPTTHEWGGVLGAVIDVLEKRRDVDGTRVGVVGQRLGAIYAPLAAAGEPRLKACIANCGPYDWGAVLPKMPAVSQETFRVRSHAASIAEAHERARAITLTGRAQHIKCPTLVIFGAGDRLISPAEGRRLADTVSGPCDYVVYEEGNHVCFNISYKFRPLTADWMKDKLGAGHAPS